MTGDFSANVASRNLLCFVVLLGGLTIAVNVAADDPPKETQITETKADSDDNSDPSEDATQSDTTKSNSAGSDTAKSDTTGSDIQRMDDVHGPDDSRSRIPVVLPDGRPLVPIMMYLSQIDELIPKTYRPVSIDRLTQAVQQMTDRATDDQASRLKGAVYWIQVVDDELVSPLSVISIESDLQSVVRRSLGKVNLAIAPAQNRGSSAIQTLPRLETEADGNLVAVFRGDAQSHGIEFQWRMRGEPRDIGTDFRLQIPRTGQTRIMISAPRDVSVEALDGVMRMLLAPPPDTEISDSDQQWYEIDAGGLGEVRLRVRKIQESEQSFVVRRTSVDYEASPSGLNWGCEMVVQLPFGAAFPPLAVRGTTITSLRVNGIESSYRSESLGGRESRVQIEPSAGISERMSTIVTIRGQSTWKNRDGWCDLPMPIWVGSRVAHASPVDEVQLAVVQPVEMLEWKLPADWKQRPARVLEGENNYSADGPPVEVDRPGDTSKSKLDIDNSKVAEEPSSASRIWSRARFIGVPVVSSTDRMLKLEAKSGSLDATARLVVQLAREQLEPLRLLVEPNWTLNSLTFSGSGRAIENLSVNTKSRGIVLWPELEDINHRQIVLEITGTRLLPSGPTELTIPPTWFARIDGVRGDLVAAIVPREDLKWSGEAAMHQGLIKPSQLTEDQSAFFGGIDEKSLWYRPENGRTPRVSLQTPSVSFNAQTEFQIVRERDEIVERLEVKFDSPGQNLRRLVVQTGATLGRPPLLWSINGADAEASISLSSAVVTIGVGELDGVYYIDVSDQNMRGNRLVGMRRYAVPDQAVIQLPTISGAASQSSHALIGPGLLVTQKSRSVQLIPPQVSTELRMLSDDPLRTSNPLPTGSSQVALRGSTRLRYDAVEQPSITLTRSDASPNVTMVWREQVRVIASSRGSDRVEATYRVSPTAPLEIEYDPELRLSSVSRDGLPVDLITIQQRPTILLQPRAKTETIHLIWNRSQHGPGWMRKCRIPRIQISGTVLKSEYQLISASDTFAPAALLRTLGSHDGVVDIRPGDNTTLVRRNVALAIGWMVAFLMFSASWSVARRSPMWVLAGLILLSTILVLWWPWRLAIIGWLIVPVVAAGLLTTSRFWDAAGSRFGDRRLHKKSDNPSTNDPSRDFSFETMSRLMLWMFLIGGAIMVVFGTVADAKEVVAQQAGPSETQASVAVLVPVDEDGVMAGEMVYVPGAVHTELFQSTVSFKPQNARFQSASYRINIDPAAWEVEDQQPQVLVEAEYLIHVEDQGGINNLVRLPLLPGSVRRIELLGDVNRIVQFKNDAQNVVAMLPAGGAFQLRVTLIPGMEQDDPWTKLTLSIPQVCSSRLTVETEETIDALRLGGQRGYLLPETDLHQWVIDLGPMNALDLRFRTLASVNSTSAEPLQRHYWINAGKRHVVIDCEVEPPRSIAVGEKFQFVVRDGEMPVIVSPNWKLLGSEFYSLARRRLLTFTCTKDSPGPVRLLWTQPATINREDDVRPVPIRIPEVIAAALGENAPAWIALYCDSALQFSPLVGDDIERLTVGHFVDQWSGYRGRIDHAYRVLEGIPMPVLQARSAIEPNVRQRHHVHVKSDRLEIQYTAVLSPSDHPINRLTLRVPPGVELVHVSANDKALHSQAIRSGDASEVLLGGVVSSESVTIKAIGIQPLPENMQFSPPRFTVNLPSTSGLYSISRDRSTTLRTVEPPAIPSSPPQELMSKDSLAQGWIPVSNWVIEARETLLPERSLGGLFEVKVHSTHFHCRQLIALNRDDRGWAMETLLAFRSSRSVPGDGHIPDYIDVEIPSRWCDSLEISPPSELSQRAATDPAFQILRIRCDAEKLRHGTISIRGRLHKADAGRVNVPSIRVLGTGQRQIHISVPDQLLEDTIQWRSSAVEATKLPQVWRATKYASDSRSLYSAANPSWSIDLAPMPEVDMEAYVGARDTQVFAQSGGALIMCHWDLFPGSLESVEVRLPPSAKVIGAWSAGQAVSIAGAGANTDDQAEIGTVEIPLALSRLPQPLQMLIQVPTKAAKQGRYVPELVGIPCTENWLVNYVPTDAPPASPVVENAERAVRLAASVVESVESIEPERPRDECAAWLRVWLSRYQMIADSVGHTIHWDATEPNMEEPPKVMEKTRHTPAPIRWDELDARMAVYVKRFLPSELASRERSRPTAGSPNFAWDPQNLAREQAGGFQFGVANFEGFKTDQITSLSIGNRPRLVQPISSNDRGLRRLIMNLLTLVLISGFLIALKPFQKYVFPIAVHPAFWLGVLGVFGFAVAPIPVAWALLLVAVALPVFPSRSPSPRSHES